jgi:TRAP-type C4-dicarboxylate transport system permease large subunit
LRPSPSSSFALILLSMPIVFALGIAAVAGRWVGGYPMQPYSSALVSGSQSWALLALPAFVFAGLILGVITATEAGAVVAGCAFFAAKLYYRNVSWREMGKIAYHRVILTAAVVFLLPVAPVYQYLMACVGCRSCSDRCSGRVPVAVLTGTAVMSCLLGMVLAAAVGIGLFLPPMGVGLY